MKERCFFGLKYFPLILVTILFILLLVILPPLGTNASFVILPLGEDNVRFRIPVVLFLGTIFKGKIRKFREGKKG